MPFSEVSIPDSELSRKATRLVEDVSPQFLYHHCLRTFVFADLIGQQQEMQYDQELLYLSAVMHDLGLTQHFDGDQRYEVEGADAAKSFLIENHVCGEKVELVWDAISLHTSIGIASRKQPEVALVQVGASMDLGGFRLEDLLRETVEHLPNNCRPVTE